MSTPLLSRVRGKSRSTLRIVSTAPSSVITLSDQDCPAGLAMLLSDERGGSRVYMCDRGNHCIDVVAQDARPLFSFGSLGSAAGQFNQPTDVAIISGEPIEKELMPEVAILAVADSGNDRVQLFDVDGVSLGSIGSSLPGGRPGWPEMAGSPFFRAGSFPVLASPSQLVWQPPFLDITTKGGTNVRVSPAAALLPDFESWLQSAREDELRQALRRFDGLGRRAEVPEDVLRRIAECLSQVAARVSPASDWAMPWASAV